ncbi:hypothetical protein ALCH109712_07745 [Alkalicoccus chagannorensis]
MQKINDERLVIQNLKNIRTAFLIQTIGIIAILLYEVVTGGFQSARENPIWIVLLLSIIVHNFLSIRVSVDMDDGEKQSKRPWPFSRTFSLILLLGVAAGSLQYIYSNTLLHASLVGGAVFICFLAPFSFIHYLKQKQRDESDK